jgi:hypothetical protein
MSLNHPTDLLPGFALGSLERPEVEKVRRHLHNCPICQAEVAGYRNVVDQLAFEAPFKNSHRRKPRHAHMVHSHSGSVNWIAELALTRPRLLPTLLLICMILIATFAVASIILWQQAVQLTNADLNQSRLVEFRALPAAPGAAGTMLIENGAQRGLLVVRDMPPLGEKMQYQLWLIHRDQNTSGGVFTVTPQGDGRLEVLPERPLAAFDSFIISIEPFGGSPWPTGSRVLRGTLRN